MRFFRVDTHAGGSSDEPLAVGDSLARTTATRVGAVDGTESGLGQRTGVKFGFGRRSVGSHVRRLGERLGSV